MKIIIATDSFKGCCTSIDAASAFEKGIRRVIPDAHIVKLPVADGGEGTVDAVVACSGGIRRSVNVTGPVGRKVSAEYAIIDKTTAVIEMASASGLPLVPLNKRNPLYTTTFGTGELIKDALDAGCRKIIIGIGGSATNDCGLGMAQALGVVFSDKEGKVLGDGAKELIKCATIDILNIDKRIAECEITALCDVSNPLTGPNGASYIYGPQKGATDKEVPVLDSYLKHFAECIRIALGKNIETIAGSGAAGGLGGGLIAFCNAQLKPGIATILELINIGKHLSCADLVITGEGRIDNQSAFGKVIAGIAAVSKQHNVPVIALAGSIGNETDALYKAGISSVMSICPGPITLEKSIADFPALAADAAERMIRMVTMQLKQSES